MGYIALKNIYYTHTHYHPTDHNFYIQNAILFKRQTNQNKTCKTPKLPTEKIS